MSAAPYLLLNVSLAGLVIGLVVRAARERSTRAWSLAVLVGVAGALVWWLAPGIDGARDASLDGQTTSVNEVVSVAVCYVSMLVGMMAEYVYAQAEKGRRTLSFVPMTFVMPILASPIVFIPLLTIAGEAATGGVLSRAKVMIYLVAFQNGFFWKSFFDQRRREASARA
jgi:hypothetical protein